MLKTNRRLAASLLLKCCMVAAVVVGQIASGPNILSMDRAQYYTNLSNVWTLWLAVAMIVWELRHALHGTQKEPPHALLTVRFALTVGVMVTFFVFNLLLAPYMVRQGRARYLYGLANAMVHNAVPLLALVDFFAFRYGYKPRRYDWAWSILMPFLYLLLVLGLSMSGYRFSGNRAPYFFLDYRALGWFTLKGGIGTFWWIVLILLFVVAMGKVMLSIHNRLELRFPGVKRAVTPMSEPREET